MAKRRKRKFDKPANKKPVHADTGSNIEQWFKGRYILREHERWPYLNDRHNC